MKITGVIFVTIPGIGKLRTETGKTSFTLGGKKRDNIVSDSASANYQEMPEPAKLSATVLHGAETDLSLFDFVGKTITVETDTGKQYVLTGAYVTEPVKTDNGRFTLDITAEKGEEV